MATIGIEKAFEVADEFFTQAIYPQLTWYEQLGASFAMTARVNEAVAVLEKLGAVKDGSIDLDVLERATSYFTKRTPEFNVQLPSRELCFTADHVNQIVARLKAEATTKSRGSQRDT